MLLGQETLPLSVAAKKVISIVKRVVVNEFNLGHKVEWDERNKEGEDIKPIALDDKYLTVWIEESPYNGGGLLQMGWDYGDDGGPIRLCVYFAPSGRLDQIICEFDTVMSIIVYGGEYTDKSMKMLDNVTLDAKQLKSIIDYDSNRQRSEMRRRPLKSLKGGK